MERRGVGAMMKVLGAVITLPLLFFIPGYVVYRSRFFNPEKLSWMGRILLVVALSASVASLVALFLAEVGHLSVWLLDLVLAAVAVLARLLLGSTRRSLGEPGPARWELVAVLLLVVVAGALFFHVNNYIVGDGDPGYYFNNGYHIAQTGDVTIHDKSVPSMSDFELKAFYSGGIVQFAPFHLRDRKLGTIRPLLFHLLPAWIGVFIMLFGKAGGLYVVPVFSLLAVLCVFAIARRYAGVWGAWAGALLATLFFPQVWFTRYPVSEIFAQFFILAAILFFLEMRESRSVATGVASALALTAAAAARPEVLLVLVPLVIVIFADIVRGEYGPHQRAFINTLLLGMVYVWLYIKFAVYEYFYTHTFFLLKVAGNRAGVDRIMYAALAVIAVCFLLFNLRPFAQALSRLGAALRRRFSGRAGQSVLALRAALALAVACTFLYYYFVAPGMNSLVWSTNRYFFNTTIFFGGVGVFFFALAFCFLLVREDTSSAFLFASVVLVYVVAFSQARVTAPYLPWEARRYMSVAIPLLFVGAGYFFSYLWGKRSAGLRVLSLGLAAGFVALFILFLAPILTHVEYRGIDGQLASFAKKVDGDVVIFTDPFLGETMGVPLRYQYGVDARIGYWLGDVDGLTALVRKYNSQGRRVLIEGSGSGAPDFDPRILDRFSFMRAFNDKLTFPRLSPTYNSRPGSIAPQEFGLDFFYLEPRGSGNGASP
jgi:hypothetical protein